MKTTAASTRTLLWGAIVALASWAAAHPVTAETTLLRCGTLIDGVSDAGREEEASRLGVPVSAHAHAAEGIKQAVLAGVRSIEHGTFVDDEGIRLMVERGVFLVPTLYVGDYYLEERAASEAQAEMNALTRQYRGQHMEAVGKALRAGVRVVVGTNYVGFPVSQGVREFPLLVEAGMTPMEAIQAGTRVNAELLGWSERVGSVEVGKLADVIAVPGDPLQDLSLLEKVSFVMKDGHVIRACQP